MEKQSKVDLVGVGLNATDTVIPLSHYPARGSKTEYSTLTTLPGGQVATTVAASPQSLILVDAEGERTVLCRRDSEDRLTLHPSDLQREWITNARALHVDG